jgi:cob(I)alamin adenosyltransferase
MKIYTKTGDKGTSALWTGERLLKNEKIFDCLGSIDELNAYIGLVNLISLSNNFPLTFLYIG